MEPINLKPSDPCPNCGGALVAVGVPTDEQRRRAADKENPVFINPSLDTMSPEGRQEHGALYRCVSCRYNTRFPLAPGTK